MAYSFAPEDADLKIEEGEVPTGKVGTTTHVPFRVKYAGNNADARISPADLEYKIQGPSGENVVGKITGAGSTFKVEWKPAVKGHYKVDVVLRNKVNKSFNATVFGAVSVKSYMEGNVRVPCGPYRVQLIMVDEDGNRLSTSAGPESKIQFQLHAPEGSHSNFKSKDNKDGTYLVEVNLLLPNTEYQFVAVVNGQGISNSPFKVNTT